MSNENYKLILNKLKPGHICKYLGEDFRGFKKDKYYVITDRYNNRISFVNPDNPIEVDWGLKDGGEYFLSRWEPFGPYEEFMLEEDWNENYYYRGKEKDK